MAGRKAEIVLTDLGKTRHTLLDLELIFMKLYGQNGWKQSKNVRRRAVI
jgi:hypothetical protein